MQTTLPEYRALLDYRPDYQMQPLTVTAHLAGTLSVTRPEDLALDGLLARSLLEHLLGDEFYSLPDARQAPLFVRLPLVLQGPEAAAISALPSGTWFSVGEHLQQRWWWYACSTARLEGVAARNTHYWNKRLDTKAELSDHIDFRGRVEKVIIENGPFKAYHQPLPVVTCRAVSWSVVGDAAKIERLLQSITGLSKKRAYGEGAVQRWQIEPAAIDESLWSADGSLARPVPTPALDFFGIKDMVIGWRVPASLAQIAFRAPQWLPYNQTLCAVGGKRHAPAQSA